MNSIRFFLSASIFLLLSSCTTETKDCICTEEFRTISVFILDESNTPVEGLTITVSDEKGKTFNFGNEISLPGYYSVMTDKYVLDFSVVPKKILFTAASDSTIVNSEFFINTDRCKCHVQKVSGPDTLIIK